MRPYGKHLDTIQLHQWDDAPHTGMRMPDSGKHRGQRRKRYLRPFKKARRMETKQEIIREMKKV